MASWCEHASHPSAIDIYAGTGADGQGAYASLDAVGGDECEQIVESTRMGGTIFSYGALSGNPCKVSSRELFYKLKKVEVCTRTKSVPCAQKPGPLVELLQHLVHSLFILAVIAVWEAMATFEDTFKQHAMEIAGLPDVQSCPSTKLLSIP